MKLYAVVLAAMLVCACSKNIQTSEDVQKGVMVYLNSKAEQTGLDMNSIQVEVASVNFEKDQAFATISITPKSVPTSAAMQISYTLDRKGDKWVVRPDSGKMHAGADGAGAEGGGSALPPGHPGVPSGSGAAPEGTALPPGHPAAGNSK